MSSRSRAAFAVALLAILVVARARAQGRGQIAGVVTDFAGTPIAGVTVLLDGVATARRVTTSDGRFEISGLDDGTYEVVATVDGVDPIRRRVEVLDGKALDLRLTVSVRTVEQVSVTADRTDERDKDDVPLSVTVFSGSELTELEAHAVPALAGLAPGLTFSQNAGFTQLTIRGIGSFQGAPGMDPGSVVYVDGVYLGRPAEVLSDFFDIKRVEVLRGPQGTLYGRNAVGGAINIVTNPPSEQLEISTHLAAGSQHMMRSETRISGPVMGDRIMATADVVRGFSRGFVQDLNHPTDPLGGTDATAVRGAVRVLFGPRSDLLLSSDYMRQNPTPLTDAKVLAVKPGFSIDNPSDFHQVRASTPASEHDVQYGGSARLAWRPFPGVSVTSVSAARWLTRQAVVDTDITELTLTSSTIDETYRQASQEVIVAGRHARADWTAGVFVFGDHTYQPRVVRSFATNTASHLDPTVDGRSDAIFGQASVPVSDRASIVAGIRYSHERKTIDNSGVSDAISTPGAVFAGSPYQYVDATMNSAWTPKLGVDYRITSDALAYVSATRGFKSGGFNASVTEPGHAFAPETAWSYEAGFKTSIWDRRSTLDVAAFYTDYANLQVQVGIRPGVSVTSNAAAATIRGLDVEHEIQLPSGWHTGGHLSWLDAKYDRYTASSSFGTTFDAAGHRLSNAPGWSGRAWVERFMPIRSLVVSARLDARWQTTVYYSPENDQIQRQGAYGLLDANATVRLARRPWSVGVFAKNLLNTDYLTGAFASPLPAYGGQPGEPRQVGIQLSATLAGSR